MRGFDSRVDYCPVASTLNHLVFVSILIFGDQHFLHFTLAVAVYGHQKFSRKGYKFRSLYYISITVFSIAMASDAGAFRSSLCLRDNLQSVSLQIT